MLYKEYIATTGAQYLIVAGDAKTYLRLKQQYGSELDWLLPFVGDWHVLYNYQKVLMHVHSRAGLKDLVKVSGFRADTLKCLGNVSSEHMRSLCKYGRHCIGTVLIYTCPAVNHLLVRVNWMVLRIDSCNV